jgi:2-dehydro-3-deoxyphosphooctonate aldolase (KDO 8-P synthase)
MLSAETMLLAAKKIEVTQGGNQDFLLTERGSMFGYGDLIVDPRNLVKLRYSGGMVVQDVTHRYSKLRLNYEIND